MHCIHRPWSAGRKSRLVSISHSHYYHHHSFVHIHVSVKRLPTYARPGRIALFSRRTFTKSALAEQQSPAAQPGRKEDDEHNDAAQGYVSCPLSSAHDQKSTIEQRFTSGNNAVEVRSDDQISSSEIHHDTRYHHDGIASNDSHRNIPVEEEEFAMYSGFWPFQTADQSLSTLTSAIPLVKAVSSQTIQDEQIEQTSSPLLTPELSVLKAVWKAHPRHGKIDLSYHDPGRDERQRSHDGQLEPETISRSHGFRDTNHPRKVIATFAELLYPHISSAVGLSDSAAHLLLTHPAFTHIKTESDIILNLLSWSWIVLAPPRLRIKRLIYWSRSEHGHTAPDVPQWLVLQLLRSARVDPGDLVDLLSLINQRRGLWSLKGSLMVLVIRLLRHARFSHPACFSHIVELFMRLLDQHFPPQLLLEDARRRAHWCNRVLTLLALPTHAHPMKHVMTQQEAQMLLLRYMHDGSAAIPLNREGYRALAKLQLMHEKTDSEKAWAKVQAHTWPPWEQQHQMGVTSPSRQSPGSTSRTNLVLERMREDGYSAHSFDVAAQILGGRDLDGSPTIQVRREPMVIPSSRPWHRGADSAQFQISYQIWKARITATRTVRQAWMGLLAYENIVRRDHRRACVYHAMFEKLWADTLPVQSEGGPLPGDGLETFADPELARDRVHVTEEPPSVEDLYRRLIAQGVRPSGRLLRDLLLWEDDLKRGLVYIADSPMNDTLKAVLTKPRVHSPMQVAEMLKRLDKDIREAYISLLARPHSQRRRQIPLFKSDVSGEDIPGPVFAFRVLYHAGCLEPSIWAKYFAALSRAGLPGQGRQRIKMELAWKLMCDSYTLEQRNFDAAALPHILLHAWNMQTWVQTSEQWHAEDTRYEPLDMSMRFFVEAVSGMRGDMTVSYREEWTHCMRKVRPNLYSVPTADDIQAIAFIMVAAQQGTVIQDILDLLSWAHVHLQSLATVSTFTTHNLAALRVYLEGQWATSDTEFMGLGLDVMIASSDQISEAKAICDNLGGWASDEDVDEYLKSSHSMFVRVKRKLVGDAQVV